MAESNLGPQWRHLASVLRGERAMTASARTALQHLLDYAGGALAGAGYDPSVLSVDAADWRASTTLAGLLGDVESVFLTSWGRAARGDIDPDVYAARHLEAVTNRLSGIPDEVFDTMRGELLAGRLAQEGIPQLAARVNALLGDDQRWTNRAVTIARTEAIGASNAGSHGAAYASAQLLEVDTDMVVKEWMATSDSRTRETHADADGQQVLGLDTPFQVGESELQYAADPNGDAGEVVNCRCTSIYVYPGDPDYPDEFAPDAQVLEMAGPQNVGTPDLVVDPGPLSVADAAARSMTAEELAMETTTRGGMPQRAAKQELARRGLTAAGEDQDGEQRSVVVVALPAPDDAVQGIGDEDKHATLLMFGGIPGGDNPNDLLTDEFRTMLSAGIAAAAEAHDGGSMDVSGVDSLGDNGARVWSLTGDLLTSLRQAVIDTSPEVSTALDAVEQYPTFTPHVTIGYTDEALDGDGVTHELTLDPDTEAAAVAVTAITFDRLALWWAGETTEWPLAGPAQEAPVDDTPTGEQVAAALDILSRFTAVSQGRAYADTPLPEDQPTPDGAPAVAQDIAADGEPFHGILWPEDTLSGDGRMIETGATVWRDLPLPLMAQDAQAPGHDGAVRVGRIDTIVRDDTTYSVPVLRYTGVWDTSAAAVETRRQVIAGVARGVSVDGDDVTVELRGSDGQPLDPMVDDFPEDGVVIEAAVAARAAGATVCSIPAFQQAYVADGVYTPGDREPGWNSDGTPLASGQVPGDQQPAEDPEAVMASAWSLVASAGPVWATGDFANPGLEVPTRLTVTDDGRVYGHLATWGVCHIGIDGVCQEPPVSATNYAYFATGAVQTDAGLASVGSLTMDTGHAPMPARWRAAAAHYDNTGSAVADVAMGQDAVGIWFAGRLRPGTTPEQVYAMRAAGSVSGDWREVGGQLELVAALVVNCPGFPIPAPAVAASGARPVAMVASGVVRPSYDTRESIQSRLDQELTAAVETVLAARDLRARATTAAARLRAHRAQEARRRLTLHQTRRATAALARIERNS